MTQEREETLRQWIDRWISRRRLASQLVALLDDEYSTALPRASFPARRPVALLPARCEPLEARP